MSDEQAEGEGYGLFYLTKLKQLQATERALQCGIAASNQKKAANGQLSDELAIEKQLIAKGLNAPRITPDHIDAQIVHEQYYVFPNTTFTVCLLTLKNGFHVAGESAAASPENFDQEIGRTIARRNARDKIWSLEGYLLRTRLNND